MNDEQLVKKLKKGNEQALEKIMQKYTALMSAIVYNVSNGTLSASDIEEVVSDSFLVLWNNADKVQPDCLKGYLCSIVKSRAKNKIRDIKQPDVLHLDDVVIEDEFTLSKHTEDKELGGILYNAVNAMGEPDSEIVLRHYYYYQSSSKISDIMGINVETVKTKIRRAKAKLKKLLEERGVSNEALQSI
ncbi:MAG: sigma-70 family RNA polymerase sigma factor [Acutalibacteraceae bacterium]|nr:sigma-70 family RNA polymerase sigma factor [Acutalibacteraceae bacterium]